MEKANLRLSLFRYKYNHISNPTEFPLIEIQNNGSVNVEAYTIGIGVYDIENKTTKTIKEIPVTEMLGAMRQHQIEVPKVEIPHQYMDGRKYSWAVKVDLHNEIDETNEDDNKLWSTDVWWLTSGNYNTSSDDMDMNSASDESVSVVEPPSGSTKLFSKKKALSEDFTISGAKEENIDNLDNEFYEGPIIYQKPDFCNDHTK